MLEKCANYEGEDRGQGRNSGCTSKESLFHNSMGPSPFSWALLACHGIRESYSDKAGIKAREWLPPALRTLPTVDQHGEKGLEDVGMEKKLLKVKQQHAYRGVCLRLKLTWILFVDLFIIFSGDKKVDSYLSCSQGLCLKGKVKMHRNNNINDSRKESSAKGI